MKMDYLVFNTDVYNVLDYKKVITRVKILLINSKDEILLANTLNDYHFIGGHVKANETLKDAVIREIEEETGIVIEEKEIKNPFLKLIRYYENYHEEDEDCRLEIYYFYIKTDKEINYKNIKLDEDEIKNNFILEYNDMNLLEKKIKENVNLNGDKYKIAEEMLEVLNVFNKKRINL